MQPPKAAPQKTKPDVRQLIALTVRLDREFYRWLKIHALDTDQSAQDIIAEALRDYRKTHEKAAR